MFFFLLPQAELCLFQHGIRRVVVTKPVSGRMGYVHVSAHLRTARDLLVLDHQSRTDLPSRDVVVVSFLPSL